MLRVFRCLLPVEKEKRENIKRSYCRAEDPRGLRHRTPSYGVRFLFLRLVTLQGKFRFWVSKFRKVLTP